MPCDFGLANIARGNPIAAWLGDSMRKDDALPAAWRAMKSKTLSDAERDAFLDSVAELFFVWRVLRSCRFTWQPVGSNGPQCGEWIAHADLLGALYRLAATNRDAIEARNAADDI